MKLAKTMLSGLFCGLLMVLLAACGSKDQPQAQDVPTATVSVPVKTTQAVLANPTTVAANRTTTAAVAGASAGPDLTGEFSERTVIRTFTDAQGRPIKLLYGRGTGHNSDYGWAHIYGKHFKGIWYDGGTLTTFPKAVGATTPDEVIALLGKSLSDPKPDDGGNGKRTYSYEVPNTGKDIFTVVGSDGTVITSYPVQHGSKNVDA